MDAASDPQTATALARSPVGYRRDKATRRSVIIMDQAADWTIKIGGLLVIGAVLGIMVFLAAVVFPLFSGEEIIAETSLPAGSVGRNPLIGQLDEYGTFTMAVSETGNVGAVHVQTGRRIEAPAFDFAGGRVTATAQTLSGEDVVFGFEDGTVAFGTIEPVQQILTADQVPAGVERLNWRDSTDGTAIYSRIPGEQVRKLSVAITLDERKQISETGRPIVAIDYAIGGTAERPSRSFVTVDTDGVVRLSRAETKKNLLTGKATTDLASTVLPDLPAGVRVAAVLMTGAADQVYVAERSGTVYRFDARDFEEPVLAETIDLFPGAEELTVIGFLIGEQSIVVGGSNGTVSIYNRLPAQRAQTTDRQALTRIHEFEPHDSAVVAFAASQRGKSFVTADGDGDVFVRHGTSEQTLLKLSPEIKPVALQAVLLAPRDDWVVATDREGGVHAWEISIPHPETTPQTVFGKVWYEGYTAPTYTWQSSSGTDSFEPKLSLVPLIFGTIKATVYSLLFAIPVALLGAIYTSEFLHQRVRAAVKPFMEMMASLPSVVLGFIAALILAPIVETWIAAVLLAFVALPLSLLAAAYLWQLVPEPVRLRLEGVPKFALMFAMIFLGCYIAYAMGDVFEEIVFYGDFTAWVNGNVGTGTPFTFLLAFPAAFAVIALGQSELLGDRFREHLSGRGHAHAAFIDLVRWLLMLLASAAIALGIALLLEAVGFDPRGGVVDTYVQRNTLVVGFAMGFAVIPIIYTIAEDALNSVPEHLRAASLACGATPWQSAIRVILPTAMSGVFAAIMIGMGRAVGETMIVVMAAGNTPILDWNIFNGLRALSANIAVELPEAVKDGTLYRMLFLAALTLLVMTFVINTVAEVIRLRFRKRAAQL